MAPKRRDVATGTAVPPSCSRQAATTAATTATGAPTAGGNPRHLFDRDSVAARRPQHRRGIVARSIPHTVDDDAMGSAVAESDHLVSDADVAVADGHANEKTNAATPADTDEAEANDALATGDEPADNDAAHDAAHDLSVPPRAPLPHCTHSPDHKPAVRRQERGSLFARLRLGGADETVASGGAFSKGTFEALSSGYASSHGPSAAGRAHSQQLEAMSEQLQAVTACMREEQKARITAEAQLTEANEQMGGLMRHLSETERARKEEAQTLAALRGLLEQLQVENRGLKDQNEKLVQELRPLISARGA